jgi:hypothetical protein
MENTTQKITLLTEEQFNSHENQNRDKAIIGFKLVEPKNKSLNISPVVDTLKPCGGCGNNEPIKRCIGCRHDFTTTN